MPGSPSFRELDLARDREALTDLLTSETWSFRTRPEISRADVDEEIAGGAYTGKDDLTLAIEDGAELIGVVRAQDIGNPREDAQLDFRLRTPARGRGIGKLAIAEITRALFERDPARRRIEGQTRSDNVAMRRVFLAGGYVQEAVYRQAWPAGDGSGEWFDAVGYAILRSDWERGETTPVDWV
ncbi:GNAT family N-acetyltransferase [Thermoleophilia bacterium SCSIO 60948]|nr:GNAT family N-acetyltransferase [Thermoleophilia bacterium SCSIO 60948]